MKFRSLFIFVVLAAIALASCAPAASAPAACTSDPAGCAKIASGQTIKIGMGAPMTGDNAQFGIDISQGAKIAITDAGDFQGWKFELVAQDDGGTPEGGASVANKLVADPTVVAIEGHIFSGATAAAIPIYEKASIPMLSPSATNPDLTKPDPKTGVMNKVFNRIPFTDNTQGKDAAEYLATKLNVKKLAILHDGQAYGKGLAEVVQATFPTLGGTVTSFDAITPGESDYTAVLSKVASNKPDAIFYGGYVPEAVVLVNELKQTGLGSTVFFGDDGTFGNDFLTRTGANGEGAYATALVPPSSPAKDKFDAAYLAAYGKTPGTLSPYTWNAYDAAAALISVIKTVAVKGSDGNLYVPRTAMVNGVRTLKGYQGITGVISCDASGECNTSGPVFFIDKSGKWVEAPK